jgi:hypothetical protein
MAFLLHSLIGLFLLVTFFVGAVVSIAISLAKATEHNQKTCPCWDCTGRRARAYEKRLKARIAGTSTEVPARGMWVSTEQLRTGDMVKPKESIYRVTRLRGLDGGTTVHLVNVATSKNTMIHVKAEMRSTKMWKRL